MKKRALGWFALSFSALVGMAAACGDSGSGNNDGDGGTPGDGGFQTQDAVNTTPCTGLECQRVTCEGGATTKITGKVYDPKGRTPLYNAIVYIPNATPGPIADGVSCDRCGGTLTGKPIDVALTDESGSFTFENVPVGDNIPIVIQLGKWRRQVTIPKVDKCVDNPMDKELTRLPKNRAEGDIPRIALTTGGADPLECLLRKAGIEDSEFGLAGGPERVHFYKGSGYNDGVQHDPAAKFSANLKGGATFPDAQPFWSDLNNLKKYDVVLMSCEGDTNDTTKPQAARDALYEYLKVGGRVFASHWHEYWFSNGPAPVPTIATWTNAKLDPPLVSLADFDTSFVKGKALYDWLNLQGALTPQGQMSLREGRHNVDAVDSAKARSWITMVNSNESNSIAHQYVTMNAPLDVPADQQCGRAVFSDLHVSADINNVIGADFPEGCKTDDLTPQEKALLFMLFDLSSCVQDDNVAPRPPR